MFTLPSSLHLICPGSSLESPAPRSDALSKASRPGGASRAADITAVPTRIELQSCRRLAPPEVKVCTLRPNSLDFICPAQRNACAEQTAEWSTAAFRQWPWNARRPIAGHMSKGHSVPTPPPPPLLAPRPSSAGGSSRPPSCCGQILRTPVLKTARSLRPDADSSLAPPAFGPCSLAQCAAFDLPRTRLWNLRLRGPTPYPLGQQTRWCFASG